jgi:uncharacterized membrane protein
VFIFVVVINFVNSYVTAPINGTIYWTLEHNGLGWRALRSMGIEPYDPKYVHLSALPVELRSQFTSAGPTKEVMQSISDYRARHEDFFRDFDELAIDADRLRRDVKGNVHPIIGLAVSILVVLTLGYLASGFLGRRSIQLIDRTLNAIPLVRSVYPYTKQFVEFALSERQLEFDTVVAAPYPSPNVWSIAFVTNAALSSLRKSTGKNLVTLFIPTSPMPMAGVTVFMAVEDLIPLPFSVDEALRITVSGGVLAPASDSVPFEVSGMEPALTGSSPELDGETAVHERGAVERAPSAT